MPSTPRNAWSGYAVALGSTALVLVLRRFVLGPVLGEYLPLLPFALAVAVSAWYGGLGPGLAATLLSALATAVFLYEPLSSLQVAAPRGWAALAVFVAVGTLVSALIHALRRARAEAEAQAREAELRQKYLEQEVAERRRVEEQLRETDRRKDEFLAMLAHELRNPLAPIRNAVQLLHVPGLNEPALVQVRDILDRQVAYLVRLVDDLLDVGRIGGGKLTLEKGPVNVATVVAAAVETSRPMIEARRHRLEVSLPPGPLWVEGDAVRLTQVLLNLLHNAAKFTEEAGQIWLTAERAGVGKDSLARSASEDSSSPTPDWVVLRVRDTGVGIPADMLARVFQLFTQVDNSLSRSQGGLGIGLTLVQRLVEMHGGRVAAFSEGPGKGSEFVVWLPAGKAPDAS